MNDTFMKTKPVFPLLVSMALPNVISMLVNSLYNIVDSLFVAQINEQAMTALSLVFPIQNFVNAVAIGFGIGINALVALYRGAGDYDRADAAATHGMALSVLHGILCTLAATAIMPGFLARFTTDGTIVSMGVTYSTIVFLFATVNMASLAFEKLFQAVGRMKLTMIALISGCVCNILLDPVLIFGLGPVPAMGIAGAALATGIGQATSLVIYLVVYSTTESPVHLRRKALRPDLSLEGRLYAIGVPAILNLALPSLLVTFLNGLLAAFSESYVVVLGIYYKLQTFLYLPANGIVQGMRPLIGYNYGAKEHARVAKLYQLTLGMSGSVRAVSSTPWNPPSSTQAADTAAGAGASRTTGARGRLTLKGTASRRATNSHAQHRHWGRKRRFHTGDRISSRAVTAPMVRLTSNRPDRNSRTAVPPSQNLLQLLQIPPGDGPAVHEGGHQAGQGAAVEPLEKGPALGGQVVLPPDEGGIQVIPPLLLPLHKAPLLQAGEELEQGGRLPPPPRQLLHQRGGGDGVLLLPPQGLHDLQFRIRQPFHRVHPFIRHLSFLLHFTIVSSLCQEKRARRGALSCYFRSLSRTKKCFMLDWPPWRTSTSNRGRALTSLLSLEKPKLRGSKSRFLRTSRLATSPRGA